jgi:thiol:disulfide interchange protein DsbD
MIGQLRPYVVAILGGLLVIATAFAVSPPLHAQNDPFGNQNDPFGNQGGAFGTQEEPESHVVDVYSLLSVSSVRPGGTYDCAVLLTAEPGWHINSASPYQDFLIPAELSYDTIRGLTPHSLVYPEGVDASLADETISVYGDSTVIRFQVTVDESAGAGEHILPLRFTFQPCDDKMCRAPETADIPLYITVGDEGNAANVAVFGTSAADAVSEERPVSSVTSENELQRLIDEHGTWGYIIALGLAFITGVLLSFSPCTYPMIPITVSVFAGQERSVGRGFILSLFYVGSMAVVYGIMGLIVSLVGGVFGAWLASTPVVIGIAVVFVIFSLSMFGLYELQVPASLRMKLGTAGRGGGVVGSIVLGIVAALVVSPCVGPFVAGILLYVATSGSPIIGFLVLFVFALGLGTLFVIIGTFSSAISALPGAGAWMETVKKFFGFVLLLMALYFLRAIIPTGVTAILAGLLLLAFGVFGGGMDRLSYDSGFFVRLKKFLGILALLVGIYLLVGSLLSQGLILPPASKWLPAAGSALTKSETELIDWEIDLESGLARAADQGRPVLIDTWATWCINCRVLDKKTFGNRDVADEAKRFVPIKVQLEKARSQITKDFMARFGLKHFSLPTTLLLDPSGNVRDVMQGFVGPEDMLARMRRVR